MHPYLLEDKTYIIRLIFLWLMPTNDTLINGSQRKEKEMKERKGGRDSLHDIKRLKCLL